MSEERKKVLEMLSEGKISVDDAERLLAALGADVQKPTERVSEADPHVDEDVTIDLNGIERRVRSGVEGVRRTVRASMPHLRTAIRDASPDVERIVKEATASVPGLIEDMTRTIRDTFGQTTDRGDDRYPAKVERDFTETAALQPSTQLVLHNPRGTIEVVTWDEEKVQADVHLTVRSLDEETAQAGSDSVQLVMEPTDGRLVVRPVFPRGQQDASYRLDILLHEPKRAQLGRVGGKFALNSDHSHLELDESVLETSINAHHGRLRLRRVGGSLALNAHRAPFEADEVHGSAVANSHHGTLNLRQVIGDLTVNSNHGPVSVQEVGGSLRLASNHSPVVVQKVGGELSAQSSHGSVSFGPVGKSAVVRCSHGPVDLGPVGDEVTVESDRGPVHIRGAGGRVTVRASRGDVRIENPAGEVLAENSRAAIEVRSETPVHSAYTLSNNRGNVRVILPEGSDVAAQGFVRKGRVETDLPLEVTANGQQGQVVSGTLGVGGPSLQAEVDGGSLILHRA